MFLIILSSLVSLFTIFILFFRVKNMQQRGIPSWFLGKENKEIIKNRILFIKPPLIPLIIIILVTIAFAICYYPQKNAKDVLPLNKSALIWLDPSLQAKLSRIDAKFSATDEAEKIMELGYKNFGLESSFKIQNGRPKITYEITSLTSKKSDVVAHQWLQRDINFIDWKGDRADASTLTVILPHLISSHLISSHLSHVCEIRRGMHYYTNWQGID